MKWIVLLGFWSFTVLAQSPMVFMRESAAGKHIILRQGNSETQLTAGKMWHLYPDISADGQWVVWVEGPNDRNLSVVLYNARTRSRERWDTGRKGMTLHPRFTKNGQNIFFSHVERGGNKIVTFAPANSRTRLMSTESDGTKVYRITPEVIPHEGQGFFPRPSADGSFVIFQRNTLFNKEIVEFNRVTKNSRVLSEGMSPALSHDENWVIYTSKVQGSWDIWLTNRHTGDSVSLTNDPQDEMAPTFTANNDVIFASNKDKKFQLYKLVDGEWQRLVTSQADDYAPMLAGEAQWQQSLQASFPAPRRSSFGSIQHDGKIYICGGHTGAEHTYPPESFTNNLQVYEPTIGRWKELAPRPHFAHGFQMAAFGKYLYAFGGFAYNETTKPKWQSLDVIDRYDTTTNTWETIGKMPRRRSSNAAVMIDSKVYLLGGWDATPKFENDAEGTFHSAVDVFDLTSEKFNVANWKLPAPLRRAFSAFEYKNHLVLVGGLGVGATHFELLNNVTLIEPVSGYARELAPLPFATFAPAAEVVGDDLMVFGGMFKTGAADYNYVSHIYAMNLNKNQWRHTGRFLSEAKGFSQVVPFDNGLAILGGHRTIENRDEPVATFEMLRKIMKKAP